MSDLVSVVMPAYNAERWIAAAIDSALAQTHAELEVVVVDDGSTDGTRDRVREAAERDPRVRLLLQSRGGPSAARNHALTHARGDYVQYLDADDLIAPDKVAVQLARLKALGPAWIATGAWGGFADDPAEAALRPASLWADFAPVEWMLTCWADGGTMPVNAFLLPRAVCDAAGPWATRFQLAEDAEYFTRLILAAGGVAFCADAVAYVRAGHASRSTDVSEASLRSEYQAMEALTEHLLRREDSPRTRRAAAQVFQRWAFQRYPRARDVVRVAEQRAKSLGGARVAPPDGGRLFRALSRVVGWKAARWVQYARARVGR